ncbi:MAG: hypothetical protein WBA35_06380, partial [Litorimonas sp.]
MRTITPALALAFSLAFSLTSVVSACFAHAADPATPQGGLVIAGGGLKADNAAVWQAFIEAVPADGPVVIVPSASGEPALSAASVER